MLHPNERLADFLKVRGWNQRDAARALRCSPGMVSAVLSGAKLPGRRLANRIEAITNCLEWPAGPVRSVEWDAVEEERERSRSAT